MKGDYALSILEEAEVASAEQEGGYQDPLYGAADATSASSRMDRA